VPVKGVLVISGTNRSGFSFFSLLSSFAANAVVAIRSSKNVTRIVLAKTDPFLHRSQLSILMEPVVIIAQIRFLKQLHWPEHYKDRNGKRNESFLMRTVLKSFCLLRTNFDSHSVIPEPRRTSAFEI
jgi:hypothetical protein